MPTGTRFRLKQFEVTDLGVQPVMWWDASDESTVTLNGENVSQIDDKSGNGLHMVQTSEPAQPKYVNKDTEPESMSQMNYKNFMYFTNGDLLETSGFIDSVSPTTECTIFLVQRNDQYLASYNISSNPRDNANRIVVHAPWQSAGTLTWDFGNLSTTGRLINTYTGGYSSNVYCFRSSVTESGQKIWENGYVFDSDSDASSFSPSSHTLRMGEVFTGVIGELIIFDQALTEYQIDQINRQLMVKWTGLPVKEDLEAWYDASRPYTITLNGSNVSQWNDISSNGNHLKQTNSSEQPIYDSSTNYIEFDSNGKELDFKTPSTPASGTILAVLEITDTGLARHAFIDGNSKSIRAEQNSNTGRLGYTYLGVGDYSGSTNLQFDVKALYGWQIQSSTICRTRFNASEWDEFGITGGELPLSIVGGGDGFTGKLYELIIFARVISEDEENLVRQYLNDKWQLGL
jgi:hypothetical protein